MIDFDLEIEGSASGFVEEHKGLNDETGEMIVQRGDEIVLVSFRPVPMKKADYAKLVMMSKAWTVSVKLKD